jgi:hypothetical protein
VSRLDAGEVDVVRFAWPDQHGLLRGKTLVTGAARNALRDGVNLTSTLLGKDTSHKTVFPVFTAGGGFAVEGLQGGAVTDTCGSTPAVGALTITMPACRCRLKCAACMSEVVQTPADRP